VVERRFERNGGMPFHTLTYMVYHHGQNGQKPETVDFGNKLTTGSDT
jgi:hypothetical protein